MPERRTRREGFGGRDGRQVSGRTRARRDDDRRGDRPLRFADKKIIRSNRRDRFERDDDYDRERLRNRRNDREEGRRGGDVRRRDSRDGDRREGGRVVFQVHRKSVTRGRQGLANPTLTGTPYLRRTSSEARQPRRRKRHQRAFSTC